MWFVEGHSPFQSSLGTKISLDFNEWKVSMGKISLVSAADHGKPTHRKVNCYAFPYFPVFTKHKQISCISYSIFLCAYACSHVHPWARGQYQCLPLLLSTFISEAKIDYIGSWGNSCLWLPPPKAQHCGYTWTKATISRNSMGRGDLHIWTQVLILAWQHFTNSVSKYNARQ